MPDEIRVMDIALLSAFRKQGIGSALLRQTLEEAARSSLPVTIHVERFNPALHLYERLGFRLEEDKGIYLFMKWLPAGMEQREHAG
jgi:ribosomal protein S18 acetylase RimI-like enzyme